MKKYINLLLVGFLVFILGLIVSNFELNKFVIAQWLPDDFEIITDKFSIKLDEEKEYKLSKAKYNENIKIEKIVDDSLKDEILVVVEHTKTSIPSNTITTIDNKVNIVFSNKFVFNRKDIKQIFNLGVRTLKEKKIYNYLLLKYSNVTVYGNEKNLEKIEI